MPLGPDFQASQPTVLLFDIDGTLILSGGAGRRALERAFDEHYGRADALNHLVLGGMTDTGIIREGLTYIQIPPTAPAIQAVLETYLRCLAEELPRAEGFTVLPGLQRLLPLLSRLPGVALGLGTGNVVAGAVLKLTRGNIAQYFTFGGYGSDSEDRPTLLRVGAERGAAQLGQRLEDCRVVVIGDTPRDVYAAKAIGAFCLGVATWDYAVETLLKAGADVAFPDLTHPGVEAALFGHSID